MPPLLHFAGEKHFARTPAELFERLGDGRFLVRCVPGVETVTQAEPDVAAFRLHPGLSFARGALDITLRVAERAPDTFLRVVGHSKGIGSTSDVEARLTLEPQEAGTRVQWGVDVLQLGGLLKAVPRGLIQAAAQKVIADAWAGVEQNLGVG